VLFEPSDFVWIHLRKDRFPEKHKPLYKKKSVSKKDRKEKGPKRKKS